MYDLAFGAFMVDIEIPILFLLSVYPPRLILHSIFGAFIFSVPIAFLLYPLVYKFLSFFDIFANPKPRSLTSIVLGAESHVFLDVFNHTNNPVFWPFRSNPYIDLVFFNNLIVANIIMHTIFISFSVFLFAKAYSKSKSFRNALSLMLMGD